MSERRLISSPLGERKGPIAKRWDGEGELPPRQLFPAATRKLRLPLTLPLPEGRGVQSERPVRSS
jgi:hypothetical protein